MHSELNAKPEEGGNPPSTALNSSLSDLNLVRIVFAVLLLLSLFVFAKSFVATGNIEQWSDDVWRTFANAQAEAGKTSEAMNLPMQRLGEIQKQWSVMRYVGVLMAVVSCFGIFVAGRADRVKA